MKLKSIIATAVCAAGLASHGVTVTTVEDLLAEAAKGTKPIIVDSPNGTYPVTFKMTDTVDLNVASATLRGATGNPKDIILDFSSKPMQGVRIQGTYWNVARLRDLTIQNATNDYAVTSKNQGGGVYTQNACVSNCIVRNCQLKASANVALQGGGIYSHAGSEGGQGVVGCVVADCSVVSTAAGDSGGKAIGNTAVNGGGIYGASIIKNTVVTNCTISSEATAQASGGAAAFYGSTSFSLYNCEFHDCVYTSKGFTSWMFSGAVFAPDGGLFATNCLFRGNKGGIGFAICQKAPHSRATDTIKLVDCTFDSNGPGMVVYAADNGKGTSYVRNCRFTDNKGAALYTKYAAVSDCYFKGNTSAYGAGLQSCASVSNCVFVGNKATGTGWTAGGSAIYAENVVNYPIVDCIFQENTSNGNMGHNDGTIRINCTTGSGYTNLCVRNCFFKGNSAQSRDIAVQNLRGMAVTPTFENRYGINIESCTFADGTTGLNSIGGANETTYSAVGSVFVRNCHFTGSQGLGTVHSFISNTAGSVQYCVADKDMTGLPADSAYHNVSGKRVRNLGQNQTWMAGAQDMGDGTYTLGKEADYGVTISFNNRQPRVLNEKVDVGCFESKAPGLQLLVR